MMFSKQPRNQRSGLSIIEVLTSIVVAMIGVFGVMVLIPFAVKQAQSGLDKDAATTLARNSVSMFEITGYRNPGNWIWRNPASGSVEAVDPDFPRVFSIDPLAVTENGDDFVNTVFPYNYASVSSTVYPSPAYEIDVASLFNPAGVAMSVADARRMFRITDDLIFGEAVETVAGSGDEDLNGPQQVFDFNGTGTVLRRQSIGRLSWSAIMIPIKDDFDSVGTAAWKYRMYVLVYKNRITDVSDAGNQMVTALCDTAANVGLASPLATVYLEADTPVEGGALRKDDWVMLINRSLNQTDDGPAAGYAEKGFDRQIAFCRVVNFSDGDSSGAPAYLPTLTLDGPDFDFGGDPSTDPNGIIQPTHVVHLKDVIAVYERTIVREGNSNWNVAF